jgi:hypothetical protein
VYKANQPNLISKVVEYQKIWLFGENQKKPTDLQKTAKDRKQLKKTILLKFAFSSVLLH